MRFIFIGGIPGTGKTTIGNHLRDNYDFTHLDVEVALISPDAISKIFKTISDAKIANKDLVVTWGFMPYENKDLVLAIQSEGATLIWFDGNRDAARKVFLKRGTVSEQLLDIQMARINAFDVAGTFNPTNFDTFGINGEFLSKDEIVAKLFEIVAPVDKVV